MCKTTMCFLNFNTTLKVLRYSTIKDDVKSVLRIGSAHNKGGPADINIAKILHLSNFSDIKYWFIFIYEHNIKPEQILS